MCVKTGRFPKTSVVRSIPEAPQRGRLSYPGEARPGGAVGRGLAKRWRRDAGFGDLDYARTMRWVIPGMTLAALGFQTILNGWFVSILGMGRRSVGGRAASGRSSGSGADA